MDTPDATAENDRAQFKESFGAVLALAKEEWPTLDGEALAATDGDLDRAVALIASHLDRTKLVIRKQVIELSDLARARASARASANGASANGASANGASANGAAKPEAAAPRAGLPPLDDVFAAIRRLESFASEEAKRVSETVMPVAETRVRKNLWLSLLMALGFGLILGLWLNGGRRR